MSLIDDIMEDFYVMNKIRTPDGEGGFTTSWAEGAKIKMAMKTDTSLKAQIADAMQSTSTYTLTTRKANALEVNDAIKKISDNTTYKITSRPQDGNYPQVSSALLNKYAYMSAERWDLA